MPNYKELYYSMFQACEQAISILTTAQQTCEELYLSSIEQEPQLIPLYRKNQRPPEE